MEIIKIGIEGVSSSVYDLMSIIDEKGIDDNLIYELHDLNINKEKPHPEFINRSKMFYKTFLNPELVDKWASNDISYAAKIKGDWYLTLNTGCNTYLGGGPTSTLNIREYCFKKNIRIKFVESSFNDWIIDLQRNINNILIQSKEELESINPPESYTDINNKIEFLGEGISKAIKTSLKLDEPNYRDLFLIALNSHNIYHFEGEALNRTGLSDLKARDKDRIVYIYEFKIHRGDTSIKRGLNQITDKYITQKNRFNGLVFINKKQGKDIGDIVFNVLTILKKIKLDTESKLRIDKIIPDFNNHKIKVIHRHIRDRRSKCVLTIFIFDVQPSEP